MSKIIGIYGLAANPPTLGHSHVIKSVLDANIVDEIWVIPTYVHFHGKNMAPYDVRVKMCEEAFYLGDKFSEDVVKIKKIEEDFVTLNPEYDGSTISMLANLRKHQDNDYRIIIGQDNADSMTTWKNGENLINNERFIVLPRHNTTKDVDGLVKINDAINGGFFNGEHNVFIGGEVAWYIRSRHTVLRDVEMLDISSTMARERCKRKTGLHFFEKLNGIVSDSIFGTIVKNHLYLGGE
jgi:nicotinate-nucleotide adenylyltransferase